MTVEGLMWYCEPIIIGIDIIETIILIIRD